MKKVVLGSVVLSSLATPPSAQTLLDLNFHKAFTMAEAQSKSNLALSPVGVYQLSENILATDIGGVLSSSKTLPVKFEAVIKDIGSQISCKLQSYRNSARQDVQYSVQFRITFIDSNGNEKYVYSNPSKASFAQGSLSKMVFFSDGGTYDCFLRDSMTFDFSQDLQKIHIDIKGLYQQFSGVNLFGLKGIQNLTDLNGKPLSESLTLSKK